MGQSYEQRLEVAEQQPPEPMLLSKVYAVWVAQVQPHFQLGQPPHQLVRLVTMPAAAEAEHLVRLVA
jgi:hypothetical protein